MVKFDVNNKLKIESVIEDRLIVMPIKRQYLGISGIGDSCMRKIWYNFRFCVLQELTPRQHRLFNRGHREEEIFVRDLEEAGVKVYGDQDEVIAGWGHMKGHIDGIGEGIPDAPKTPHLLEFKTMNDKNFKELKRLGVKESKPAYYAQVQVYMKLKGLKRCLHITINKNDDSRYYERIKYVGKDAIELIKKGEDIIMTEFPDHLPKIGKPSYWLCKYCDFYDICHYGKRPYKTCRTCSHAAICEDGIWECENYRRSKKEELSLEDQLKACEYYKPIVN